ncbi:hypothetical protein GcM1_228002 [Golovinomyces cichoracearum]|uniref:Uncharacterized protein n=1 Tax=Golovinomyces cichoracearum TaxID=62708 RepID=A0A420INX3_9PEZI|nr:hypothetical protein GcM1_228002 [Golovinomyces cichoracearum]
MTRVDEAQSIYGEFVEFSDSFTSNPRSEGFAPHMRNALEASKEDISTVIEQHLESYIRGLTRPPRPYTTG